MTVPQVLWTDPRLDNHSLVTNLHCLFLNVGRGKAVLPAEDFKITLLQGARLLFPRPIHIIVGGKVEQNKVTRFVIDRMDEKAVDSLIATMLGAKALNQKKLSIAVSIP